MILKKNSQKFFLNNSFLGNESISGPGSDLVQTDVIKSEIPRLFRKT